MVQYKFTFFDSRANAETVRLILHYAGVPFEDHRITRDEWPEMKPKTPFGQLPVLEVDGVQLAQTNAIARYLAQKHGLAGKNEMETAQIDAHGELLADFYRKGSPYIMLLRGFVDGDKEELHKQFHESIEQYLSVVECLLKKSKSGYFAESGLSWVDFALANLTLSLQQLVNDDIAHLKATQEHSKRVHALPQLKKYLDGRKEGI